MLGGQLLLLHLLLLLELPALALLDEPLVRGVAHHLGGGGGGGTGVGKVPLRRLLTGGADWDCARHNGTA